MTDEQDNTGPIAEEPPPSPAEASRATPAPWLAPHRWKPGQSGNPTGRPRESGSLAAALRRVGVKPAKTRAEINKLAEQLGLDSNEAQNIDVVAGLIYDGITQLLIRTVKGSTGAGDKVVGLLQLLFKALDGDERHITVSGPGELQAALSSVSAVLGFRPGNHPSVPGDRPEEFPETNPLDAASPSPKPPSTTP